MRFCLKGHDTWVCGRCTNRRCRECKRMYDRARHKRLGWAHTSKVHQRRYARSARGLEMQRNRVRRYREAHRELTRARAKRDYQNKRGYLGRFVAFWRNQAKESL